MLEDIIKLKKNGKMTFIGRKVNEDGTTDDTVLYEINLKGNDLNITGVKVILDAIFCDGAPVERLDLRDNTFNHDGTKSSTSSNTAFEFSVYSYVEKHAF